MTSACSTVRVFVCLLPFICAASAGIVRAQGAKPRIAVFSGPNATIQHTEPLVTSNTARAKYGLPPIKNPDGSPVRFDALRPQRLAAPVTIYIEAFSAHPLEADTPELYAPPDGYMNPQTRVFSKERQRPDDIPVYEATLRPEDGQWGEDFFTYGEKWEEPVRSTLARLTNVAQRAMGSGTYAGGIWLEGSTSTEETT